MYDISELEEAPRRLTRKERRNLRNKGSQSPQDKLNFNIKDIRPLTINQHKTFQCYEKGNNLMLHGYPGTGKTFIALYLALKEVLSENSLYKKIIIVRSAVPVRDIGFLPGKDEDKIKVYEPAYVDIFSKLFGRGDAYSYLKLKGIVEFRSTSFIRSVTIDNAIIIPDEMANYTFHELDSVITRAGKNCKFIFCGDFRQSDFKFKDEKEGIHKFMKIIKKMNLFDFVEFDVEDIVRSELVKQYIIALMEYEEKQK